MIRHANTNRLALALLPMLAVPAAVHAQIEEILVTAQKREQSLQDTPIALTALSAEAIDKRDIIDVHALGNQTPNLYVNVSQGDSTTALFSMRGVVQPNPSNLANESTVGLYLDGIYVGKGTGAIFDLADIERIEVLRGPQGTLYGKNTIGGAINIISARPSGEFGGSARLGVGSDNLVYSKVNLDLPAIGALGEGLGRLAAKVSLVTRQHDGYVKNNPAEQLSPLARPSATSADFSEQDVTSGRLALQWELADNAVVDYSYDTSRVRNTTPFFQLLELAPTSLFNPGAPFAGYQYYNYLKPGYPDEGSTDFGNRDHVDIDGHGLTLEVGLGEELTLKSITGFRQFETTARSDFDGGKLSWYGVGRDVDYDQLSQEVQLLGSHDQLNWVAGLYYFAEEGSYYSPRIIFGELMGNNVTHNRSELDNDLKAVFGQVDWNPAALDRLTLSLGLRYSEESKDLFRAVGDFDATPVTYSLGPVALPTLELDSNTSVMASATWAFTDALNAYVKFAQGYRSGGYDGQTSSLAFYDIPFESDEVDAYEIGIKSRWLDDRLQVNGAWFFSDYQNMQLTLFNGTTSVIENAGEAEITGLELELVFQPVDHLTLSLSYGYLDPDYNEYLVFPTPTTPVNIAATARFPHTPENSVNASVDYRLLTTDVGALEVFVDYSYTGAHFIHPYEEAGRTPHEIDSRGLVNARLSLVDIPLGSGFESAAITLWAKNLTDEEYITTNIPFGDIYFLSGSYGDPRTFGAEVTLRF